MKRMIQANLQAHIQTALQDGGFDVSLTDQSRDMGMLSLQGPASREILAELTDAKLDNASFPFSTHQLIKVGNTRTRYFTLVY